MKIKAEVVIDLDSDDFAELAGEIDDDIVCRIRREIVDAIHKSEAFRELKQRVYNACLDSIRKEIAAEFIDKIKGE